MHGKLPTYLALSSSTAIDSAEIVKFGYKVLPAINYKDFTLTWAMQSSTLLNTEEANLCFIHPQTMEVLKKAGQYCIIF